MTNCRYSLFLSLVAFFALALSITQTCLSQPLVWDAETKACTVKTNETHGHLFFSLTNISSQKVVISNVTTSCGCTVAKLPKKPWIIEPNESGRIDVEVDVRGKTGTLTKQVSIVSPTAAKLLDVSVTIPNGYFGGGMTPAMGDRLRNQEATAVNRQSIFRDNCASCHLIPAFGKTGANLYQATCAICHDSPHRATMVPDLHHLNKETNADFWREWITNGKEGTLMPAFAATQGGPLDEEQIKSLVDYMVAFSKSGGTNSPSGAAKKN